MYKVTRRFTFEAAHRLPGYEGKCKHLHGHSYTAEVTVQGESLNEQCMLIDFGVLKSLVGRWIDDSWDHNVILAHSDSIECSGDNKEPFDIGILPTAEVMARVLYKRCVGLLDGMPVKVVCVRIQETRDCWAEYCE